MLRFGLATLLLVSLAAGPAPAIVLDQVDDFEDGTTQGWREGENVPSPNPPTNMASGGPAGADDAYLRVISSGTGTAGSRMAFYNSAQWRGNYTAAGVMGVRAHVRAFSGTAHLRAAVDRNGCRWVSTTATVVASDGLWHTVAFDLGQMTRVEGTCQLSAALDNALFFRIISSQAPAWRGDAVALTLGFDNITALNSVPVEPSSWGGIKARHR